MFSPDSNDKFIYTFLNSEEAWERQRDYLQAQKVDGVWVNLFKAPLNKKAWKRMFLHLCDLDDRRAFEFVK